MNLSYPCNLPPYCVHDLYSPAPPLGITVEELQGAFEAFAYETNRRKGLYQVAEPL